ncbi:hypothetical protein M3148_16720 [Georgenia satyanarayanai]|uniref:hypothetical protein n=1 Tax=Georgenia satyanarayanai TaxID=860221 RepID=UPI00203A9485|nr:hypothetical protein [Georgenia satyanarayanai]MCM3662618.1 hypothetical protein [Georgenia satyanarayanai]
MITTFGWPLLLGLLILVLLLVIAVTLLWNATSNHREIRAEDLDPEAFEDHDD